MAQLPEDLQRESLSSPLPTSPEHLGTLESSLLTSTESKQGHHLDSADDTFPCWADWWKP